MSKSGKNHWVESRALLENARHEYLILRRGPADESHWDFPGDRVQGRESPEAALRRALREELGVEVTLSLGQPPFAYNYGDHSITYRYYVCATERGEPQSAASTELRWIPTGQLREYVFEPAAQQVVQWLLEQQSGGGE